MIERSLACSGFVRLAEQSAGVRPDRRGRRKLCRLYLRNQGLPAQVLPVAAETGWRRTHGDGIQLIPCPVPSSDRSRGDSRVRFGTSILSGAGGAHLISAPDAWHGIPLLQQRIPASPVNPARR